MNTNPVLDIVIGLKEGRIVPYLGPGALSEVTSVDGDIKIPADSDSLILAMNNGQPMAPRLMYEFPRAAMNLELKKGRRFVEKFLTETYGNTQWSSSPLHDWLVSLGVPYIIDINRDTLLQEGYSQTPHLLVVGTARLGGTDYRFKLYQHDGTEYRSVTEDQVDTHLPVLFKPMGTPIPEPSYIAADADYVDYITELMGGFAIPGFLKQHRTGKRYLFLGMRMTRDTERMVLSDMIYDAAEPAGWAMIPDATAKERRYCLNKHIEVLDIDWQQLLKASDVMASSSVA